MRHIILLFLIISLVFSITACGEGDISSAGSSGTSSIAPSVSESGTSSIPASGTNATEGSSAIGGTSEDTAEKPVTYETRYFVTCEEHFGEQSYKETWTYDDMGNILTHAFTAYYTIAGDNPSYSESFRYDEQGRLIYEDTDYGRCSYTYNDQGLLATETILNKDDSISDLWTYTYNEKGDIVKKDNGKYGYAYTYDYGKTATIRERQPFGPWLTTEIPLRETMDLSGNVLKQEEYRGNEWKTQTVCEYDKNGNVTYFAALNGKNIAQSYVYDDQNNLLEEFVMDTEGNIFSGTRYTYTVDGKIHTKTFYDVSINDFRKDYIEFAYDERGNIITHIFHEKDGSTSELDVSPPADQPADVYDDADNLLIDYQGEGTRTEYTYIKLELPTK